MRKPTGRPLRARGEPHLSSLNASAAPRYWDGRIREVVAVHYAPPVIGRVSHDRIETLSCGHEKVPSFRRHWSGGEQWRVCFECPGMAEARR